MNSEILLLEPRDLRRRGAQLGRGVRHVEVGGDAAGRTLLGELQALLGGLDVVPRDLQQQLVAAQLDVVARQLGEAGDQRGAPEFGRCLDRRGCRFDRAPHPAPHVDLPRGVEPHLVDVECIDRAAGDAARGAARRAVGAERGRRLGEHADIARLLVACRSRWR